MLESSVAGCSAKAANPGSFTRSSVRLSVALRMSASTSKVFLPLCANRMARLQERKDLPSPSPGLVIRISGAKPSFPL